MEAVMIFQESTTKDVKLFGWFMEFHQLLKQVLMIRGGVLENVLSLRTSSRTHFEVLGLEGQVLGLGLEALSPQKLPCPRLKNSTISWIVKSSRSARKIFWKTFFSGDCLKNLSDDLFLYFFYFWRALALVSLVLGLGLEHSCPWPREGLSSVGCPWHWPRALCPRLHLCWWYCRAILQRIISFGCSWKRHWW